MWPFAKQSARRKEIRRTIAERRAPWRKRLRERVGGFALGITLLASLAVSAVLNAGGETQQYQPGQFVPRAVASRVDFQVEDRQQTRARKLQARDTAPNYYRLDASLLNDIQGRLTNTLNIAKSNASDPERLKQEAAKIRVLLDDEGVAALVQLASEPDTGKYASEVTRTIEALSRQPLVEAEPEELSGRRTPVTAILLNEAADLRTSIGAAQLLFSNNPNAAERVAQNVAGNFAAALRPSMTASITAMLQGGSGGSAKPIYRYDAERSARAAEEAYDAVPTQYLTFARGDALADRGVIGDDELERLVSEHAAFARTATAEGRYESLQAITARSALAFLVVFGLAGYVWRYRPTAFREMFRVIVTAGVLVGVLAIARIAFVATGSAQYAVGAQALAATLLAVSFAQGPVYAICGALAALITLATQQDIGFLLVLLVVSGTQIFTLRDVRNRGKIVAMGLLAGSFALVAMMASLLISAQTFAFALQQALVAAVTTIAAAFVVEGALPWIERLFGLSTSMTLLEWCDANKLLMRMMAAEAPGTYNHSLLVGTLAEKAAEAIGANGLLARAGAYYHDIGKIHKPQYFVENQDRQFNRHERLSPAMSLLIIVGHVKNGIEMAREYGLPSSLRPFIAEHHGTTLVEYFYHAANKARKAGDPEIPDTDFRYPGPKPQSRESAVVMICDGVEGAVRAMSEPTPGRIEEVVTSIARKRLLDGQFDDCELTLRDLEAIERSLIKSLCGIYHARIAYPAGRPRDDRPPAVPERSVSA